MSGNKKSSGLSPKIKRAQRAAPDRDETAFFVFFYPVFVMAILESAAKVPKAPYCVRKANEIKVGWRERQTSEIENEKSFLRKYLMATFLSFLLL